MCEAIAKLLSPYGEVVLHDPQTDRIVQIWNAFSGRAPGERSLLNELEALSPTGTDVYGPYPKVMADGRRLSSVSAIVRDAEGRAEVVLCVNLDRSAFDDAARLLSTFAAATQVQPHQLFELDWHERLNEVVAEYVRRCGTPVERLKREQRREVFLELKNAGIFTHRGSMPVVARTLAISRSSAYHVLAETRKDDCDPVT